MSLHGPFTPITVGCNTSARTDEPAIPVQGGYVWRVAGGWQRVAWDEAMVFMIDHGTYPCLGRAINPRFARESG